MVGKNMTQELLGNSMPQPAAGLRVLDDHDGRIKISASSQECNQSAQQRNIAQYTTLPWPYAVSSVNVRKKNYKSAKFPENIVSHRCRCHHSSCSFLPVFAWIDHLL
jgi:hypothetical protein